MSAVYPPSVTVPVGPSVKDLVEDVESVGSRIILHNVSLELAQAAEDILIMDGCTAQISGI